MEALSELKKKILEMNKKNKNQASSQVPDETLVENCHQKDNRQLDPLENNQQIATVQQTNNRNNNDEKKEAGDPILDQKEQIVASEKQIIISQEITEPKLLPLVPIAEAPTSSLDEKKSTQKESFVQIQQENPNVSVEEQRGLSIVVSAFDRSGQASNGFVSFQMNDESKVQKKTRKIALKQLSMVKKCIQNIQGSIKGLEEIERRIKIEPNLKDKVRNILKELQQLQNY